MRRAVALWMCLLWVGAGFPADRQLEATDPVPITPAGVELAHPVWSPTGEWIAATSPNYQGIWILRPDGSDLHQISAAFGAGYRMEWSPDGTRILSRISRREGKRRVHAVQVLTVPEGKAILMTDWLENLYSVPHWIGNLRVFVFTGRELRAWSIDASASVQPLSALVEGTYVEKGPSLFVSGRKEPIFTADKEDAYVLNTVPSPDGSLLAFEVSGQGLYVASRDGKTLLSLGDGHRPRWSPDATWLICFRSRDDGHRYLASDLYAVRVHDGTWVQLTDTEDRLEMDPSWSPDGRHVVFYDYNVNRLFVMRVELEQ